MVLCLTYGYVWYMNQAQIQQLVNHTLRTIQHNSSVTINGSLDLLRTVTTYSDYQMVVDRLWGWETDTTAFLLDGYHRLEERAKDKINTPKD